MSTLPAFSPASLELLPGESARPPLRLLERSVRPALPVARAGRVRAVVPQSWWGRLRQLAAGR